jgi:hypothetical protein
MILRTATANTIYPTLLEKTTISNPRYLFAFMNKETMEFKYCLVTEIGTHLERNNEFVVTLNSNPTPTSGQVNLVEGDYIYTAYELTSVQAAALNFNSIDTSSYTAVESMKVRVVNASNNANTSYTEATRTNTVYEG